MKQIQKPANTRLSPFRKLAVAACLVTTLGCGAANETVIPDYWGMRHTEVSHSKARLTNLFREKTVDVAGTKVSFVIPNDTLSDILMATKRHRLTEERRGTLYARHVVIKNVPFGSQNGKMVFSDLGITYGVEKGTDHAFVISFDKALDTNPEGDLAGTKVAPANDFSAMIEKISGEKIYQAKLAVETIGIPTTAFAIPLNEKGVEIGLGPWGQLVAGLSFNPSKRELVARPVIIVPEGKTREEARDALMQKLGNP